ncbi:hypothetical protein DL771_008447 [Monosporascus sp. 5C6A]|nr:hypothetical protein DL771_008447 [Monosporascus sp. 5C6A]
MLGETANSYSTTLTARASSGVEGALVSLRGSLLGVDSDIRGSIRSLAANCGSFVFKPTATRLPITAWAPLLCGAEYILLNSPPSASLEGLKLHTKTIIDVRPWLKEPNLVAMDWRDTALFFPDGMLEVAVTWEDGVVKPHPPITRAMRDVVEKLKGSGNVKIVDWKPWNMTWHGSPS